MYQKVVVSALFVFITLFSLAQGHAYTVRGIVRDSAAGNVLEEATVSLFSLPGPNFLRAIRSNGMGFLFHITRPGNYLVVSSYLGYQPDSLIFAIGGRDTLKHVLQLRMRPSATPLMEVVVKATIPPVLVKDDTIAFNAGAYPTRPYSTVEELLKKMPGIEVDKDGNITMQGKKVDKLLVDGKEFFIGDMRTATRNLPAEIVSQIETYDTQTEQGKLTGVRDNTGGKTLNIKVKKDRKDGFFGKVYAGGGKAGSTDAYSAGGDITQLGNERWMAATFNANNINNQFNGQENFSGSAAGAATYRTATANFRQSWKKWETSLAGSYNSNSMLMQSTSVRQSFLTDSSLVENRADRTSQSGTNWQLNGYFNYHPDSMGMLIFRTNWTPGSANTFSSDTVGILTQKTADTPQYNYTSSLGKTINSSSSSSYSMTNSLDYRLRGHRPGRNFYIGINQSVRYTNQPSGLYSLINNFDSTGNPWQRVMQNQQASQLDHANGYGGTIQYTQPLFPQHVLDFSYNVNTIGDRNNKNSFDYDSTTGRYDQPDTLTTNHFFTRNTTQRFSAGFNASEKTIRYQLGAAMQLTSLLNDNYSVHSHLIQQFRNWYPRANLMWTVRKQKTLQLNYTGFSAAPTIDQLQPLPDLTNPYLVKLGNPDLKQQFAHNVSISYNSFNIKSLTNFSANLSWSLIEHQIVAATTALAGGVQQMQFINVEGNYTINTSILYGISLPNKTGNIHVGLNSAYSHAISMINGQHSLTTTLNSGGRVAFNYHPLEKLYFDGVAFLNFSESQYSVDATRNTHFINQTYNANLSYEFPLAITLVNNCNWQISGAQGSIPGHETMLWNIAAYKSVFRNHAGQIRFSIFDILNNAKSIQTFAGSNYIMTTQSNLPGRLWLLTFLYNIRAFPHGRQGL